MENLIDQLIADFHERELPHFTRRHARLPMLPNKVDSVIGMRRSGKTWFLYQAISDLLAKGAKKESILYINFEDERMLPIKTADLHEIPDVYYRRYPHLKDVDCTFMFDEIQNVPGWEKFIRRLLDQEKAHICITGSSARLLSREIATSLRGRAIPTEIFPFSFTETLEHADIDWGSGKRPGAKKRALLENRFRAYLLEGGFPEIQGIENNLRLRMLQDYLNVVLFRDIVERYRISSTAPLRYMIRHLLNSTACLFSVNKFYNDIKSQGISCSKNTLHEYLGHLSDAFLLFQVPIHTHSERGRMVNPKKIYAIDTGLIQACVHRPTPDWGHLLENFVFLKLRRSDHQIEYYRTKAGREVDFIVTDRQGKQSLIQVSAEMKAADTKKRELAALSEAMRECAIDKADIITMDHEEDIKTDSGYIKVSPAWLWAL